MQAFHVPLSASDHLDAPGTFGSVEDLLSGLRAHDVVQATAKVMQTIESVSGGGLLEAQKILVNLFPPEYHENLLSLLELGPANGWFDVLFFPQQMLVMQRLALSLGEPGDPSSFDDRKKWGDFLLAAAQITDLITQTSGCPDLDVYKALGTRSSKQLAIQFLRSSATNTITYPLSAAGRAYRLWLDSPVEWPEDLETPESFAQRTFGITLNRFVAIALAPAFARVDMREPDPEQAVFDRSTYFRQSSIPLEEVDKVLERLTFRAEPTLDLTNPATFWDLTPLADRPYLPAGTDLLVPSSVSKAFDRATVGIFWLLHREMRSSTGDVQKLTDHFGRMFEDYCCRLVRSSVDPSFSVSGDIEYDSPHGTHRSSDILMSTPPPSSGRIFIECSALRPTVPVLAEANESAFDTYFERLSMKLGQLDRVISAHQESEFVIAGDVALAGSVYFPVLVVDEPFEWSVSLRDLIEAESNRNRWFRQPDTARPIVCHVGELENLCDAMLKGAHPVETLRSFLLAGRSTSLSQYLYQKRGDLSVPGFVRDGFSELSQLLLAEYSFSAGGEVEGAS